MVVSTLALALLSLTAVTSAVVKRDFTDALQGMQLSRSFDARQAGGVAAVNQSIAAIGASLAAANNSVVAFDGGIGGLLSVNEAVVNLGTALNQTTTVAESTPLLSPTDSTAVGIEFLFLQPNINLLLQNLDAKQGDFDNALFGILDTRSLIRDTLIIQQNNSAALGTALLNVLDPSLRGIASPINDQIQGNFTAAVNAWQGRSGTIAIPQSLVPAATKLLADIGPAITGLFGGSDDSDGSAASAVEAFSAPLISRDSKYCCGITQERLDALGPDENDLTGVPGPLIAAFKIAGILPP
ncbi:hypothetical protein N0V82_004431 [Gnomoniopsis sp. IMI 355080]|nr:hypothetical protein N0V82_004431 [Gnomoniopsis sp. IMI 355080]